MAYSGNATAPKSVAGSLSRAANLDGTVRQANGNKSTWTGHWAALPLWISC